MAIQIDPAQVERDLEVPSDYAGLIEAASEHPRRYRFYADAAAETAELYELRKIALKSVESQSFVDFKFEPEKPLSDKHTEKLVDSDPGVIKARKRVAAAKRAYDTMVSIRDSMRSRKDMMEMVSKFYLRENAILADRALQAKFDNTDTDKD